MIDWPSVARTQVWAKTRSARFCNSHHRLLRRIGQTMMIMMMMMVMMMLLCSASFTSASSMRCWTEDINCDDDNGDNSIVRPKICHFTTLLVENSSTELKFWGSILGFQQSPQGRFFFQTGSSRVSEKMSGSGQVTGTRWTLDTMAR